MRVLALSLLISAGTQLGFKLVLPCILLLQISYFLALFKQPYSQPIHMVGLISCELTSLYSFSVCFAKFFY
jgi:hypothetical protein